MGGKNAYLLKQKAEKEAILDAGFQIGFQQCIDYVTACLRDPEIVEKDIFGEERIMKLFEGVQAREKYYRPAHTQRKDADWYQEKLDDELRPAYGANFQPYKERYPQIIQLGYDKMHRQWKD